MTKVETLSQDPCDPRQQNRVRTRFKDRSLAYHECLSITFRSQVRKNQVGGDSKLQNPFWTNRVLLSPKDTLYDWTVQDPVWPNAVPFQKFLTRVAVPSLDWSPCILSEANSARKSILSPKLVVLDCLEILRDLNFLHGLHSIQCEAFGKESDPPYGFGLQRFNHTPIYVSPKSS